MDSCCSHDDESLTEVLKKHKVTLWTVLLINLAMFVVEAIFSYRAGSTALLADSLDMLGDAAVYGISYYAIGRGPVVEAKVSLFKGFMMGSFGIFVIVQAAFRYFSVEIPVAETVGVIGFVALAANLICALLLLRHRDDNLNMKSVWLCTRNDVLANIGVIASAGLVQLTSSKLPDLVVGVIIAVLVLKSSVQIIQLSAKQLS